MMTLKFFPSIFIVLFLILVGCSKQSDNSGSNHQSEHQSEVIDKNIQSIEDTIFENEYIHVFKCSIKPGQQLPWHNGGSRLIYSESDYSIRFKKNPTDTVIIQNNLKKGEVHWHEKSSHTVENIGNTTAEFVIFMRKPASLPELTINNVHSDVEDVKSQETNVLLQNDFVKAIKVNLSPGVAKPMHVGTTRIVYSLTDYSIKFTKSDQPSQSQKFSVGDVHWHQGGEHAVENTGASDAEFLIIEFKQ